VNFDSKINAFLSDKSFYCFNLPSQELQYNISLSVINLKLFSKTSRNYNNIGKAPAMIPARPGIESSCLVHFDDHFPILEKI